MPEELDERPYEEPEGAWYTYPPGPTPDSAVRPEVFRAYREKYYPDGEELPFMLGQMRRPEGVQQPTGRLQKLKDFLNSIRR